MAVEIEHFILELSYMQKLEDWNSIIQRVFKELNNLISNNMVGSPNEKLYIELLQILIQGT